MVTTIGLYVKTLHNTKESTWVFPKESTAVTNILECFDDWTSNFDNNVSS